MAELAWTTASITTLAVDAVVTAANAALAAGGGVDGAIHRAAGPELLQACRALGGCPTGGARITPGFRLRARFVIHAVGPIWQGGHAQEEQLLASAYRASCALADAHGCARIAFPAISCGIYGYPIPAAMATAVTTLRAWRGTLPERILLIGFDPAVMEALQQLLGPPQPG